MFFSRTTKPPTEINQVPAIMLSYAILIENFQCREQKQSFPNEDSTQSAVLFNRQIFHHTHKKKEQLISRSQRNCYCMTFQTSYSLKTCYFYIWEEVVRRNAKITEL